MTAAYFAFPVSDDLHTHTQNSILTVRQQGAQKESPIIFTLSVERLVDAGFDYFFHKPISRMPLNETVRKTANAGINTALGGIQIVVKKVFKSADDQQLRAFADYLDQLVITCNEGKPYLAFPLNKAQHEQIIYTLNRIRTEENTELYNHEVANTVIMLIDTAFNYYYHRPADIAKLSRLMRITTDVAMKAVDKGAQMVVKQLFKKTHHKALIVLSEDLERLVLAPSTLALA